MTDIATLREAAHKLKYLQQTSPSQPDGLTAWDADARRFTEWEHANLPDLQFPSLVMFYLHDADLRLKDPEYRKTQNEALDELIADLEQGVVPESSGHTISFHPRSLGAIALALLAAVLYWVAQ